MGQNNDPAEHGELQGNQGGNLSKDSAEHQRIRQEPESYALSKSQRRTRLKTKIEPEQGS